MNKKGEVITIAMVSIVAANIIAVPFVTPKFRVRKAVEKCVSSGEVKDVCQSTWEGKTKQEVLDYIRDI